MVERGTQRSPPALLDELAGVSGTDFKLSDQFRGASPPHAVTRILSGGL